MMFDKINIIKRTLRDDISKGRERILNLSDEKVINHFKFRYGEKYDYSIEKIYQNYLNEQRSDNDYYDDWVCYVCGKVFGIDDEILTIENDRSRWEYCQEFHCHTKCMKRILKSDMSEI